MTPELRCPPARRLYIAVPAYTGEVKAATALALIETVVALTLIGVSTVVAFNSGCCYLDHTRNMLATAFLASDATDLLFVDADVGFKPAAAIAIARSNRPFVAGIYPKKSDEPGWPVGFEADVLRADEEGYVEAAFVPTGFLRLHRSTCEMLATSTYEENDKQYAALFRCGISGNGYVGEDVDLCRRWRRLGGQVFILPELEFNHTGAKTWEGSWGKWMRSRLAA